MEFSKCLILKVQSMSFNYTLSIHWQYQRQNGGTHEIGTIAKLQ